MKKAKCCIPLFICMISLWGCVKENFITDEGNLVPKTVDVDRTIPSISVNGTVLHAETFGNPDSAMIVVLHGGPGADYRHLLNCREFASQGYYVVFYDQRGSGLSKRHSKSSYGIQTMLDDLSAVIAHYRKSPAQKVFLLGHSWGAILATSFIDKYPTAISGTILAEPGGFTWPDIEEYVTRSRDIRITSELAADFLYADQFITGKKDEHAILDYKYALLSSSEGDNDNPTGNEGSLLFWRAGAVVNQALFELGNKEKPDWTTHLSQYHTRVLFVYSERNRAYGAPYAQKVSSAYPNVQLFKVNGAGHDMISFPTGWNNFFPTALNYLNSLK
jgi:proline iminopeptidase